MERPVTRHFCTYFDHRYLARGLALYESLKKYCPHFRLWVLCMDSECHDALSHMALPCVSLIKLEDFERANPDLAGVKPARSVVEYYFTCSPVLPMHVLDLDAQIDLITYLDSDLFFFADPAPLFKELGAGSVAIIEHRFSAPARGMEMFGLYNVGFLIFRRDENGLACLRWWRQRCIEWCFDRWEKERFADQKYLDEWPKRFKAVVVLKHKGANVAPWNVANYEVGGQSGRVAIDGEPLVFFHFQGFRKYPAGFYDPNFTAYRVGRHAGALRHIYLPYIETLREINRRLAPYMEQVRLTATIRHGSQAAGSPWERVLTKLRACRQFFKGLKERRYVIVIGGRIFQL